MDGLRRPPGSSIVGSSLLAPDPRSAYKSSPRHDSSSLQLDTPSWEVIVQFHHDEGMFQSTRPQIITQILLIVNYQCLTLKPTRSSNQCSGNGKCPIYKDSRAVHSLCNPNVINSSPTNDYQVPFPCPFPLLLDFLTTQHPPLENWNQTFWANPPPARVRLRS